MVLYDDFTEESYKEILDLALKNYKFISFKDYKADGKVILWRHDMDFSVHRAYSLAKIDAAMGVKSTFFIHLHSAFYNALDEETNKLVKEIHALGHDLGLHFEPGFYNLKVGDTKELYGWLEFEKTLLQKVFEIEIASFSFHNPDVGGNWMDMHQDEICCMVNAYGMKIRQNYGYCSDSNGYWRFEPLKQVVSKAEHNKLHVLTHAEWWTPAPMSPRDRVLRCIKGRADRVEKYYDDFLKSAGRENIR